MPSLENWFTDLRTRMRDSGISGKRLAKQMGRDPSQVSRWFKTRTATLRSMQSIEQALTTLEEKQTRGN